MCGEEKKITDSFDEYLCQCEPHKRDKVLAWKTAIGLQVVDGLITSKYLIKTVQRHIKGDIFIDEARSMINTNYQSRLCKIPKENNSEEANKVSVNIAKPLNEQLFLFP